MSNLVKAEPFNLEEVIDIENCGLISTSEALGIGNMKLWEEWSAHYANTLNKVERTIDWTRADILSRLLLLLEVEFLDMEWKVKFGKQHNLVVGSVVNVTTLAYKFGASWFPNEKHGKRDRVHGVPVSLHQQCCVLGVDEANVALECAEIGGWSDSVMHQFLKGETRATFLANPTVENGLNWHRVYQEGKKNGMPQLQSQSTARVMPPMNNGSSEPLVLNPAGGLSEGEGEYTSPFISRHPFMGSGTGEGLATTALDVLPINMPIDNGSAISEDMPPEKFIKHVFDCGLKDSDDEVATYIIDTIGREKAVRVAESILARMV